jgi:hypothetical protein
VEDEEKALSAAALASSWVPDRRLGLRRTPSFSPTACPRELASRPGSVRCRLLRPPRDRCYGAIRAGSRFRRRGLGGKTRCEALKRNTTGLFFRLGPSPAQGFCRRCARDSPPAFAPDTPDVLCCCERSGFCRLDREASGLGCPLVEGPQLRRCSGVLLRLSIASTFTVSVLPEACRTNTLSEICARRWLWPWP